MSTLGRPAVADAPAHAPHRSDEGPGSALNPAYWKNGIRMILVLAGALTLTTTPVRAQDLFGSIAYSRDPTGTSVGAMAWNTESRWEARTRALRRCRADGGRFCQEVGRFQNACGAIATGDGSGYGTGWGESIPEARSMALANCRNHGVTNCRIRAAQCAKAASPVTQPTRSTVRRVQADLARLGYKPGPADGIAGRRTAAAVKRFQSDSGLPADGVISPALVKQLRAKARAAQTKETPTQPRPEKAQAAPKETPAAVPAGEAGDLWGALAVSQNPGGGYAWGIAWNAGDRAAAKRRAVRECRDAGGKNCREGGSFKSSCSALAVGDGAGWGSGGGDTPEKAAAAATAKCGQYTDNCQVVVSRCSDSAGDAGGVAAARPTPKETPAAPAAGKAGDLWGSIAYSPTSRLGMIVWNYGGRGAAKQQSLQGCRRDGGIGCKEVAWFQNACGAIAIGGGTGYGGGWGESKAESERMALSNCRSAASNCKVEVSRCTDTATEAPSVTKTPAAKEPVAVTEKEPAAVLSPKCPGTEVGIGYNSNCWLEFVNRPGCHYWNSYNAMSAQPSSGRGVYRLGLENVKTVRVWVKERCRLNCRMLGGFLRAAQPNAKGNLKNGRMDGLWVFYDKEIMYGEVRGITRVEVPTIEGAVHGRVVARIDHPNLQGKYIDCMWSEFINDKKVNYGHDC